MDERYAALLDFDNYLDVKPKLSPRSQDFMTVMYGPPKTLGVEVDVKPVPSTTDAIQNAEDYLTHEKKKGFVNDTDMSLVSNPLFRTRLLRQTVKEKAKQIETDPSIMLSKLFEAESYQKFWFESKTVVKALNSIQSLPYIAPLFQAQAITSFIESVATLVRVMKHNGFLEVKKKSIKEQRQAMTHFVTKTKESRVKIITQLIHAKRLDISKLSNELKTEFASILPAPEKKEASPVLTAQQKIKQQEVDQRILAQVAESATNLPACYRYNLNDATNEAFTKQKKELRHLLSFLPTQIKNQIDVQDTIMEHQRPASSDTPRETEKKKIRNTPNIITKPFTRTKHDASLTSKRSRPPVMTRSEIIAQFWQYNDPLCKNRPGKFYNTLGEMQDIVDSLSYDKQPLDSSTIPQPFEYESKDPNATIVDNEGVNLMNDIWNTADVKSSHTTARPNKNSNKNTSIAPMPLPMADFSTLSYDGAQRQIDIIAYVQKFSLPTDQQSDENAANTHAKLSKVWDELGFSIQQKLGLVLKYSENPEEGARLKDALQMWEQALEISKQYENDYQSFKEFLNHDVFECNHPELMINQLDSQLANVESSVYGVADILKKQYEDDLILKRRKYTDLLQTRRNKLAEKINEVKLQLNI